MRYKIITVLSTIFVYLVTAGMTYQSYIRDNYEWYARTYIAPYDYRFLTRDASGAGLSWPIYWPFQVGKSLYEAMRDE